MAETKAARKRDGVNERLMLRFNPEAMCGVDIVADECGLESRAATIRLLVHEALKARGMDRKTLREMLLAQKPIVVKQPPAPPEA